MRLDVITIFPDYFAPLQLSLIGKAITDGLLDEFGPQRVIDTPLAESGIVGTAIGLAYRGFRPVVEIQFDGFVFPGFAQIVSQVAKMHMRTGGPCHRGV